MLLPHKLGRKLEALRLVKEKEMKQFETFSFKQLALRQTIVT